MAEVNKAAWLYSAKLHPFKVDEAPMPTPGPNEVVVRNYAVAANPVDTAQQDMDRLVSSYPFVIGTDSAGIISAVGAEVTNFTVGDRVVATAGKL
jgi:NADPH:quinone reductase-like Zn-dependent oxidoreductase